MRIAGTATRLIALPLWLALAQGAWAGEGAASPADLQFDYAEGLFHDNLPKQAIVELEKFLKENPNDPRVSRARFYLGECHYKEKRYDAALPAFEAAAKDEKLTMRPIVLYRIGDIRFRLKDMAGAPLRYDSAIHTRLPVRLNSTSPARGSRPWRPPSCSRRCRAT